LGFGGSNGQVKMASLTSSNLYKII